MYCGCSISDKGIGKCYIEGFLLEIDKNEQFLRAKLFFVNLCRMYLINSFFRYLVKVTKNEKISRPVYLLFFSTPQNQF